MPTLKQQKAIDKVVENHGNISKSMRDAGYDETTAKNPKNLTESKAWKEAMGLVKDDKILKRWEGWALKENKDKRLSLDAGKEIMKIKNRYPKEGNVTAIQVNVGQDREEFK